MLKLRSPIKTVLQSDFLHSQEAFYERIRGNYMQIGAYVGEADLLHVTTEPPEIFVVGGGMGGIFQSSNTENVQINKVNIINNLLNRIIMSVDGNMSYQDQVYITNILHKLGIRDERKFMTEVYRVTNETKALNDTINLYWENLDELQVLVEEYITKDERQSRSDTEILTQNILHLHEEVNRRLNTAAIYRVMQNFSHSNEETHLVTKEEYNISEQTRLSKEILLNRLRETVRDEALPLTYRHENYYEGDQTEIENVTTTEVSERITSAVLLNMIDNLYESIVDRVDHNVQNWISTEETYYGAAENTLYRISEHTAYLQYLYESDMKENTTIENYRTETELIKNLLSLHQSIDLRLQQSVGGNIYENETELTQNFGDTLLPPSPEGMEPAEMTFVTNEGDVIEEENRTETKNEINEELYQTYQQNIARHERYMQNLRNIIEQNTPKASDENPVERTFRESLQALEHPEEFRENFGQREQEAAERIETIRTESERLLPPGQQMIYSLIREYIKAPERFYKSERISTNNLGLLLRDIKDAEYEEAHPGENAEEIAPVETVQAPYIVRDTLPPEYPPSSDTTVKSTYPSLPGQVPIELTNQYATYQLANIYPTYYDELILADQRVTVEEIARAVQESAKETIGSSGEGEGEGPFSEGGQTVIAPHIERSFTNFVNRTLRTTESEMVLHRESQIVDHVTEHIIERWMSEKRAPLEPVVTEEAETISMVHRSKETTVDEEVIEQMQQEIIRLDQTNRTIQQNVENRQIENHTVINNMTQETVEHDTEAIRNIVTKSMHQQLDEISEKVYGKLEKQLRNEQRRRGL
ncbi:MAG: hypothetical protein K6G07_00735 [Lachnospiraceae bacterium]|nr:hypothetical protein [Lachnospiraceae bacterium]